MLIEKPLADTLENAKILLDACEGYPYKTMVGHICRFDIRYERAYEAIRDGTLGEIIYISSKRNSPTLGAKRYARQCKLKMCIRDRSTRPTATRFATKWCEPLPAAFFLDQLV